jgi:hypothetical protein
MQLYRILNTEVVGVPVRFAGTLNDAKDVANEAVLNQTDMRVELVNVPTEKPYLLCYLNGKVQDVELKVLRTWALTDRGGLKEVPNGE